MTTPPEFPESGPLEKPVSVPGHPFPGIRRRWVDLEIGMYKFTASVDSTRRFQSTKGSLFMKLFDRPDQIRCGVVGYGASFQMGKHHINAMTAAGLKPVAVADIDPERLPVAEQELL